MLNIVNPGDKDYAKHRYLFHLGACGWTKCLVWANSYEAALDEVADWCASHAPGLLADEAVAEEYNAALAEGSDEEAAYERATLDTLSADHGHYLLSWEVQVTEDPCRAQLLEAAK